MSKALTMDRDDGRVTGFRTLNEEKSKNAKYVEYDPKAKTDPRKAYYAKYLEPAIKGVEQKNINNEKIANLRNRINGSEIKTPNKPIQDISKIDFNTLKKYQDKKQFGK